MILFFDIDPNTQQVCYAFTFYIITSILTKKLFGIKLWVVLAITRASGLLKQLLVLINYIYGLSNRRIELLCTSSRSFLLEFLVCLSLKCGCVLVAFCLYMFLTKVPLMCLLLLWIMRILMELELQFRFLDWSVSPCIRAVNTTLCLSQS